MTGPVYDLLMTRPAQDSLRFVGLLPTGLQDRLRVWYSPLIRILPTAKTLMADEYTGIIFTSANAVTIAKDLSENRDLPCFCVGESTTQTAIQAGWTARFMGESAKDLIQSVLALQPNGPLIHLKGAVAHGEVAARLTQAGLTTHEQNLYKPELSPLTQDAKAILAKRSPTLVPLFSSRTGSHFASQSGGSTDVHILALSQAVANSLGNHMYKSLTIVGTPTAQAMVLALETRVNHLRRVEGGHSPQ